MVRANATLRRRIAMILPVLFLVAVSASGCAWGQAAEEDSDRPARLTVMADFNRDGIADIAEVTLPAGGQPGIAMMTVSLGQADGSLKPVNSIAMPGREPKSIVAGDFNGDSAPDLVVGNDDGSVLLYVGDGTGKLAASGEIAHFDSVVSIATADFNHDNILDLAVSDWHASTVTVLLGNGNGSFRREWSFRLRMPGTAPHISAADFDGDGNPDLAVVYGDDAGYTFDVMLGDGKGMFTRSAKLSFVKDPNSHCAT
jgi:hypothetical protein